MSILEGKLVVVRDIEFGISWDVNGLFNPLFLHNRQIYDYNNLWQSFYVLIVLWEENMIFESLKNMQFYR